MRLAAALAELDALYNLPDRRRIAPDLNRIRSLSGPQLLRTKYERLAVLKEAGGLTYNDLINDAHQVNDYDSPAYFSSIQNLLTLKRIANRPKDALGIANLETALKSKDE